MSAAPAPGAVDPRATYTYVDSAFGSVEYRNNIRRVDLIHTNGQPEQYASYQRGTMKLWNYVRDHKNRTGRPSVAGFPGATWTPSLPLDFDARDDPARALAWLRQVLKKSKARALTCAVRCFFSGGKGFHAEIPAELFGGFDPSTSLHRQLKRAAELLLGDIPFDGAIYDTLRLWRLNNSRHGTSGLYKIRLSARELLTHDMEAIKALAGLPRAVEGDPELAPLPEGDILPNEFLAELWAEAGQHLDAPTRERRPGAVTDDARDRQTIAAIAAGWPQGGPDAANTSRHTDYLMPMAGFLAGHTSEEHARELLISGADAANDTDFLTGRDWEAEIERLVAGSVGRRDAGQPFTGLPTLAERFPALANVLGALWPDEAVVLGAVLPDPDAAPPFPVHVLPGPFREFVKHGAESLVAPPDFIAVPLLTYAGAALGNALELELRGGWREAANLYTAYIGDPGSKKSPGGALAARPIHRLQRRLAAGWEAAMEDYESGAGRVGGPEEGEEGRQPGAKTQGPTLPPRHYH